MEIIDSMPSPAVWPEPDILNAWLDFLASAIGSLAWPAVVVALIYFFREPIVKLIDRMRTFEAAGTKFSFADQVQGMAEKAAGIETPDPQTAAENATRLSELIEMAAASPMGAIMEAWKDVETNILDLIEEGSFMMDPAVRASLHRDIKPQNVLNSTRLLRQFSLLPDAEFATYQELRTLRNKAAHERSYEITTEAARQYVRVADRLVDIVKSLVRELRDIDRRQ